LQNIIDCGLHSCLARNDEIFRDCSIVFIAIPPQSMPELRELSFQQDTMVISCMAGVPLQAIRRILGIEAVRMMPNGPSTIQENRAIAAIYPNNGLLIRILQGPDLRVYRLLDEELMHIFTVGVCLPAAFLISEDCDREIEDACKCLSRLYPDFAEICSWARDILPDFRTEEERRDRIGKMATKGGITEAIVESLRENDDLLTELEKGIERSRDISSCYGVSDDWRDSGPTTMQYFHIAISSRMASSFSSHAKSCRLIRSYGASPKYSRNLLALIALSAPSGHPLPFRSSYSRRQASA
jgi:pyrroline-5-carboxylate reductase